MIVPFSKTSYSVGNIWEKVKPKPGDIVCHYLFTKSEWKALVLRKDTLDYRDSKTYIRMLPGVMLEEYFEDNKNQGWIYTKWIWVLKEEVKNVEIIKTLHDRK